MDAEAVCGLATPHHADERTRTSGWSSVNSNPNRDPTGSLPGYRMHTSSKWVDVRAQRTNAPSTWLLSELKWARPHSEDAIRTTHYEMCSPAACLLAVGPWERDTGDGTHPAPSLIKDPFDLRRRTGAIYWGCINETGQHRPMERARRWLMFD